jgi:hypothetical protein
MEKIGVEVEKTKKEKKEIEKHAHVKSLENKCNHPATHVYKSDGVEFCRKCEKYLKIF